MRERRRCLTFLLLGFILDHVFGPRKDNLTCLVFVFRKDMSNGIYDPVLQLKREGLHYFIFLKYDGLIRDLDGKFWQKQVYLFTTF